MRRSHSRSASRPRASCPGRSGGSASRSATRPRADSRRAAGRSADGVFSGSTSVSLRSRNSTGSMPAFSASSSMADSNTIRPGSSPGPRTGSVCPTSSADVDSDGSGGWGRRRARVPTDCTCSRQSPVVVICTLASWPSAMSRPSGSPRGEYGSARRYDDPTRVNICRRVITSFTGRLRMRVAIEASTASQWSAIFEPNPPPR